jgi:hypothetical protein
MNKNKAKIEEEELPASNAFEDMLRKHRRGIAATKASTSLREAIQASRDTGANSEVTIKIKLRSEGTLTGHCPWSATEEQIDEWTRKPEDKRGKRPPRPAAPGKSRHHNGIAVDIQRSHGDKDEQGRSAVDRWLDQNAPKYGFAARVSGEPWQREYVGAQLRA